MNTVIANYMLGYGNHPRFDFTLESSDYKPSYTSYLYKHITGTSLVAMCELDDLTCYYQSVHSSSAGNLLYALGPYKSGYSSRISVINKQFNVDYVEAGMGRGLRLFDALATIAEQCDTWVLVYRDDSAPIEIGYELMPWDFTRSAQTYTRGQDHLFLHTKNEDFATKAYLHLMTFNL